MSQQPVVFRITPTGRAALAMPPERDVARCRNRQRRDQPRWDITALGRAVLDATPQRQESAS